LREETKNVLAIGPHPDDIEIGCFGTLLRHKKAGDNISVLITTKGGYSNRSWDLITSEYHCSEKILGIKYEVLDNTIAHYNFNMNTVSQIDEVINKHNIDTIYCNWYGDAHQDHQASFNNILAASRKSSIKNLFCYELGMYNARTQLVFKPHFFVDISEFMDLKIKAVSCYQSYFTTDRFIVAMEGLARQRGYSSGVKYAESFEIIFNTWR
jgi:N-acetylglucosamine malate deacetylase 1